MRPAEVAKYWEAINRSPKRPVQLKQLSFRGLPGIADSPVEFDSPLTAICGLNGSGKSALLRTLWSVLDWAEASQLIEVVERLQGTVARALLVTDTGEVHTELTVDTGENDPPVPEGISVKYLDLARLAPNLQEMFCSHAVKELLDAYEPIDLSHEEIGLLSFICRKDFKGIKIYEIDEFGGEIYPFVIAADGDHTYDIRTMSLGEISIFVCYWTLRRATAGTIVLMEEPETYIAPVSQTALIDFLARVCVTKSLTVVFTTHSPPMFARLKANQIKFLFRDNHGSHLAAANLFDQMRRLVGLTVPTNIALVVEDRAAREFARLLLAKLDLNLAGRSELIDVGGHANVTALRQRAPRNMKSFSFLGIYDGDMRGSINAAAGEWPLTFLPDNHPVERLFRETAGVYPALVAEKLGRDENALAPILAGLAGLDDHDWLEELAKRLKINFEQVMMACFEAWYSIDANKVLAAEFVASLGQQLPE